MDSTTRRSTPGCSPSPPAGRAGARGRTSAKEMVISAEMHLGWPGGQRPAAAAGFKVAIVGTGLFDIAMVVRLSSDWALHSPSTTATPTSAAPGCSMTSRAAVSASPTTTSCTRSSAVATGAGITPSRPRSRPTCATACSVDLHPVQHPAGRAHRVAHRRGRGGLRRAGNARNVTAQAPAGQRNTQLNAVLSAVGQLSVSKLPAIPKLDHFCGRVCHSAAWDARIDPRCATA